MKLSFLTCCLLLYLKVGNIQASGRATVCNKLQDMDFQADGYTYSIETDCYSADFECPEGTWCQVEERANWYPYDVSYINRGRCLPYAKEHWACEMEFDGETSFPRKADGSFFERPTLCDPATVCTGDHIFVLPPTCVKARDPIKGCLSTQRNGCSGRTSLEECPDDSFCIFPSLKDHPFYPPVSSEHHHSYDCSGEPFGGVTQSKLEQCATILTSFNGPNFAFTVVNSTVPGVNPDDNHFEVENPEIIDRNAISHGTQNAPLAQQILKTLWPYPVCGKIDEHTSKCTTFPLPVPARGLDGQLIAGTCLEGKDQTPVNCDNSPGHIDMSFLHKETTNGATDYHCTWMVLHTLAFNGPAVLSRSEKRAFGELLMYISGQFDCKVCRNNFVNIIKHFGLPKGNIREDYAWWLWQAHNNANEHSYATHSYSVTQAKRRLFLAGNSTEEPFGHTRTDQWQHPKYEHAWYMKFDDAVRVWTNVEGLSSSMIRNYG